MAPKVITRPVASAEDTHQPDPSGATRSFTLIPERYYVEVSRPSDIPVDEMKKYIHAALVDWRGQFSRLDPMQDTKFGIVRVERRPKPATVETAMSTDHMLDMGKDREVLMDRVLPKRDMLLFDALTQVTFAGMDVSIGMTPEGKRQVIIKEI